LFDGHREGLGQQPGLFEQLDDGQADELQIFHSSDFGFSSPQSAQCGKKDGRATISVFANPFL
jgi:hypothetical protein